MICSECKKECYIITIDQGVGYTEYGSSGFNDIQLEQVSNCCEAPVYDKICPECHGKGTDGVAIAPGKDGIFSIIGKTVCEECDGLGLVDKLT